MALEFCCGICHETYQATDQIYSINCGHVFHYHCITDWLKRSSTCSECRASCLSSDLRRIFITSQAQNVTIDELLETNAKLKSQLDLAEKDLTKLRAMLHNKVKNFVDQNIQDQLPEMQNSKELEVGISQINEQLNKSYTEAPTLRQDEVIDSIMLNKDQLKRRGSNQNELQSASKRQSPKGKKVIPSKPKNHRVAGAAPKSPAVNSSQQHESTYCIFQHAQNLRKVGFREVFISKEKVYAKKSSADPKIQITSRRHVDELIASSK